MTWWCVVAGTSGYIHPQVWRAKKNEYCLKIIAYDYGSAKAAFERFLADRMDVVPKLFLTDLKRTYSVTKDDFMLGKVIMAVPSFEV